MVFEKVLMFTRVMVHMIDTTWAWEMDVGDITNKELSFEVIA